MKPIAIFPGHVGKDTGAVGKTGSGFFYAESAVNFAIAIRVVTGLNAIGIPAQLYCGSLTERVKDSEGAPLGVSIHADSLESNAKVSGFHLMYYSRSVNGKRLAVEIHEALLQWKVRKARKPHTRSDLKILRDTKFPCVLLEAGFLTNDKNCSELHDPEWQERVAMGVVAGIVRYADV